MLRNPGLELRMLAQGGKAKAARLQAHDQGLKHGRRPGIATRPDAQVRHQNVTGAYVAQRCLQKLCIGKSLAGQLVA
jgi:hypothetical protein